MKISGAKATLIDRIVDFFEDLGKLEDGHMLNEDDPDFEGNRIKFE